MSWTSSSSFQGASYFRAVARDQLYGLSARGLALGTGGPEGEEFPLFRQFWIHEPEVAATSLTIHALLDSPSVTGAYEFVVRPGVETVMDVRSVLFPRVELTGAGIAPLTSMYFFGPKSRARIDDYRDAVHDSSGLQMVTGAGERIWRPLDNPLALQFSAFSDHDPQGFGLTQRERAFIHYEDAEARYERRPSAWVAPSNAWGQGSVVLVEIPTDTGSMTMSWRSGGRRSRSPEAASIISTIGCSGPASHRTRRRSPGSWRRGAGSRFPFPRTAASSSTSISARCRSRGSSLA